MKREDVGKGNGQMVSRRVIGTTVCGRVFDLRLNGIVYAIIVGGQKYY